MKEDKGGLLFCWLDTEYAGIQPRNCISDALASNEYFDCLSVFRFRCRHLIYRLDLFSVFPPPFILMSYEFFLFYFQLIHSICFIFRTLRKRPKKKKKWVGKSKKKKKAMKRKWFLFVSFLSFCFHAGNLSRVFFIRLTIISRGICFYSSVLLWMQWKLHLSPAIFFLFFFFYFNSLTLSLIYSR